MTWKDQDDLKQKAKDRDYVSCDEPYELQQYIERYGKAAVEACCRKIQAPRPRAEFEACLKQQR